MYAKIAKSYNELYGDEQRNKLRLIKSKITVNGWILDIGSGMGISAEFFKNIILLEPEINLLKQSKGKKICGRAEDLPFKNNSFDCIICVTAIHHFNLKQAIQEIKRVSKKEARYAFTIMKKAKNFEKITKGLHKNFNLKEIDEEKDLILLSQTY